MWMIPSSSYCFPPGDHTISAWISSCLVDILTWNTTFNLISQVSTELFVILASPSVQEGPDCSIVSVCLVQHQEDRVLPVQTCSTTGRGSCYIMHRLLQLLLAGLPACTFKPVLMIQNVAAFSNSTSSHCSDHSTGFQLLPTPNSKP